MSWLDRLETKGVTFTPATAASDLLPRTTYPYARAMRDALNSNVLMSPLLWLMRTFTEAEPVVERKMGDRPWAEQPDHDLTDRLRNPNPYYDGPSLFQVSLLSYFMDGNAYWRKIRNAFGGVLEYRYLPHWSVEPRGERLWEGDDITYYEYSGPDRQRFSPDEVVHLRFGVDPRNPRKGLSHLKALMREAFTDDEAANFSATILRNMGVPGVLVSPKPGGEAPQQDDVDAVKAYLKSAFTGDLRGEPLVMGAPTDVVQFGFDPNRLTLGNMRDIAEERVCAALGVQAAVVGFGSGLQSTKVGATMQELRQLSWRQGVYPHQRVIAAQLTRQTLPDFQGSLSWRWRVRFRPLEDSEFQEEEDARNTRILKAVSAGVLRVDLAQAALGLEVDDSQKVYLRPSSVTPVEQGDSGLPEEEPEEPAGATPDDGENEDDDMTTAAKVLARMKGTSMNGRGH